MKTKDYNKALQSFQKATLIGETYKPFQGQEVLYLFLAVTQRIRGEFEQGLEDLEKALTINPEYARAYIGRGNIYYEQGIRSWSNPLLEKALREYKKALEVRDRPASAYITEKVKLSLGNVYSIRAQQTNDPELFKQANENYAFVIARYEADKKKNQALRGLAARAYFGLGIIFERQENFSQAREAYQDCLNLADNSELSSNANYHLDTIEKSKPTKAKG